MNNYTSRALPESDKNGNFLFDQVRFCYDPIQWTDDKRYKEVL